MTSTFFPVRLQDRQPPTPQELILRQNQHTGWVIQREAEAITVLPVTLGRRWSAPNKLTLFLRTTGPKTVACPGLPSIASMVIMRVSLPWAPYYGTESEVASMLFASRQGVPVPEVYFFDSSAKNDCGIEFTI
ncbi:hypothetical protein B0T21DRAFT_405863 [Apiosordaria backusii]|uniref:Uncharacterized protein n=1 Tax=Apiosordaria backusii TaxID=314023 RepID=A0AA40EX82_9PEZI|nr:hypothetical protein B0T21DRAFT_405863 [Apiosordaria backusii]